MNNAKVIPINNRVLVKPKEAPEKTSGGLYIPETAKEKTQEGEVLAVGNGKEVAEAGLKAGDRVLFEKYGGDEIELDGRKHLILQAKDILAKIE